MKWIDCENTVVMLPAAEIAAIFLGPGTSVTHEAVKVLGSCGCSLCFVGEDCLSFHCHGISPTADTRNMLRQLKMALSPAEALNAARRFFGYRFPQADLSNCSLQEIMGIEGSRVKELYRSKALQYGVPWQGRAYIPGKPERSDLTNMRLTLYNSLLYGLCTSVIIALGYSPHVGFIHSGSPLPLTYDLADLYKEFFTIDLAFSRSGIKAFKRQDEVSAFVERCREGALLKRMQQDLQDVLEQGGC